MMQKRFGLFAASGVLAFALAACGGGGAATSGTESTPAAASTVQPTNMPTTGAANAPTTSSVEVAPTISVPTTVAATVPVPTVAVDTAATGSAITGDATSAALDAQPTSASDAPATEAGTATAENTAELATVGADGAVTLLGGKLTMKLPPGFTPLTKEEIGFKFPRGNPPGYVYGDERRGVSIAVSLPQGALTPQQLPEFKQVMEGALEQSIPGLEWVTRDFITINGREWVHLELKSTAIDTQIHNNVYMTSFEGKPILLNFNSTIERYEQVKTDLEASRDSIQLTE